MSTTKNINDILCYDILSSIRITTFDPSSHIRQIYLHFIQKEWTVEYPPRSNAIKTHCVVGILSKAEIQVNGNSVILHPRRPLRLSAVLFYCSGDYFRFNN